MSESTSERPTGKDFIRTIVEKHIDEGTYGGRVTTRFPPEPNGYLHIGHAKSICLNFGIAEEYGGRCHLRYDDTNPLTEEESFTRSMREDIRWLGYDWGEHLYYASDYFEQLYGYAVVLIEKGLAYVDSQSEEEIRETRGSVVEPGTDSPYRERSVEENLDLFRRMREGEFRDGEHVLRARIDMAHPNMIMRDPILYRILHAEHYRTGDAWCIYPLYDFAHCLEDAIEDITHSFCTLEFENNREIYDWILDNVGFEEPRTHQYEFARLNLQYTVLSKRKLIRLVREGHVEGWDDPRMPTIAGIRRRGIPPEAVRTLCDMVGVTKAESRVDVGKLEYAVRDALNPVAPRVLAVLKPLKVVLTNHPEGKREWLDAPYYPRDVGREGTRPVPFGREILIERGDFAFDPPKGWKRLAPGVTVRLRHGYVITFEEALGPDGEPASVDEEVTELRCRYDPDSLGRNPDGVKVSGVLHWVEAEGALACTVRLVDRLFSAPDPENVTEGEDFTANLNPTSMEVLSGGLIEPSVADDPPDTRYQFERTGYFWRDPVLSSDDALVFNRVVALRDSWATTRGAEASVDAPEEGARSEAAPSEATRSAPPTHPPPPGDRVSDDRRAARSDDPSLARRFDAYQSELGLPMDDADILTGSRDVAEFFEATLDAVRDAPGGAEAGAASTGDASAPRLARAVAGWIVNDVLKEAKDGTLDELPFGPESLGRLIGMVLDGRVSRIAAKDVLTEMAEHGGDPEAVVRERGLEKLADPERLDPVVERVLGAHPDEVEAYRAGKTGLVGFFVGRVLDETGGAADPKLARSLLEVKLGSS